MLYYFSSHQLANVLKMELRHPNVIKILEYAAAVLGSLEGSVTNVPGVITRSFLPVCAAMFVLISGIT